MSDAVIAVRRQRLPDPTLLGNAGSFFHNPIVSTAKAEALEQAHPGLVSYPMADDRVKLAAGWLIDQLGLRGVRRGAVAVHDEQALVLVNHGGGTGAQLMNLVAEIRAAVTEAYHIDLTIEPLII